MNINDSNNEENNDYTAKDNSIDRINLIRDAVKGKRTGQQDFPFITKLNTTEVQKRDTSPVAYASTKLKQANDLILEKISAFDEGSIILGFLPLSIDEVNWLISEVKQNLNNENLYNLLRIYPAAISYFFAVTTSKECTSGKEFWKPLTDFTGLKIESNNREALAKAFSNACSRLGLLEGSLKKAAWVNVAPFLFQAGILHGWSERLAKALKTVVAKYSAPDLENIVEVRTFIKQLSENSLLNGMDNLKHTLQSEVGPLLIQRLISAYQKTNWSELPAHLETPISEAFQAVGRGAFIHPPYLKYNQAFDETELILPAQNNQLAAYQTKWEVNKQNYSALYETTIPIDQIDQIEQQSLAVKLYGLEKELADRNYSIEADYDEGRPFKIFQLRNGREKKIDFTASIKITPDDYLIVMDDCVSAGYDDAIAEQKNGKKIIELSLRPGESPLCLKLNNQEWQIGSLLKSGFYTNLDVANIINIHDGGEIFYGHDFGIIGYFPKPQNDEPVILTAQLVDSDLEITKTILVPVDSTSELQFSDDIDGVLKDLKAQLNYGIHPISLRLTQSNKSILKEFWVWKGLNTVNLQHGFNCDKFPQNIDIPASVGLFKKNETLYFESENLSPYFTLKLNKPELTLKIPRPGVEASLAGLDEESEVLLPGQLITVSKNDKRVVQLKSGGFETWKVYSGSRLLLTLDQKHTQHMLSLSGLAAEIGHSGLISVEDIDGNRHKLFAYSLPLNSSHPKIEIDHANRIEEWSFKIATDEVHSLGYRIADLSDRPCLEFSPIKEFISKVEGDTYTSSPISLADGHLTLQGVHQSPKLETQHSRLKISISIDFEKLEDRLYAIDIFCRTSQESEWLPLSCQEKQKNGEYNSSTLRFFAWGDKPYSEASNFWQKLRGANSSDESDSLITSLQSISNEDLEQIIPVVRELLSFKYPTSVWLNNASRLTHFMAHLSKHCFRNTTECLTLWWDNAAVEVIEHASLKSTPVIKNFIFATLPEALGINTSTTVNHSDHDKALVGNSISTPSTIKKYNSKLDFILSQPDTINQSLIPAFGNFIPVSTGQETKLKSFLLDVFLETGAPGLLSLAKEAVINSEQRLGRSTPALLSSGHLLQCIRRLNLRCKKIQDAINAEEVLPLQKAAQTVESAYQNIEKAAPDIAKLLNWKHPKKSIWIPPLLKSDVALKIASLTWCVVATARLSAKGKLPSQNLRANLSKLLCRDDYSGEAIQYRLNIILSLAPELFSFYIALFELSIDSQD